MLFILACHFVTHLLAAHRAHLEFSVESGIAGTWINWLNLPSVMGAAALNANK